MIHFVHYIFRRKQKLEKEKYLKNADHKVSYIDLYSVLLYTVQYHHEPFLNLSLKIQNPNPKSTQFDLYIGPNLWDHMYGPFTIWTLVYGSTRQRFIRMCEPLGIVDLKGSDTSFLLHIFHIIQTIKISVHANVISLKKETVCICRKEILLDKVARDGNIFFFKSYTVKKALVLIRIICLYKEGFIPDGIVTFFISLTISKSVIIFKCE